MGATDTHSADGEMADGTDGTGQADSAGIDGGSTTVDVTVVQDTQMPDTSQDDAVQDASSPDDVWTATDSAEPQDVADAGTSECQLLTVDNALGEKCSDPMSAICDPDNPQDVALLCHNTTWQKMSDLSQEYPFGCFCDQGPDPCKYAFAACAVPGFVGLDRAGRVRVAPRKLRRV